MKPSGATSNLDMVNTTMEESMPSSPRQHLKAAETANFAGSLVVNQLDEAPRPTVTSKRDGKVAEWVLYFEQGWVDKGIWKSAVGSKFCSVRPQY